jgi:hypothetical protein
MFQVFLGENGIPYTDRSPDVTANGKAVLFRIWPQRSRSVQWPTVAVDLALLERLAGFAPAAIPRS